jgi:hypothetical protein
MTQFQAARLKKGLVWDNRYGWILGRHRDRYENGHIYDFTRRKWTTLGEANEHHSQAGRDWVIRTEHLEIHGSASLAVLAEAATKLELFHREIFGVFASFFADSRRVDSLRLALGLSQQRPLVVWIYRTRKEYLQRADAVKWSAGIFRYSTGTSYFYGKVSRIMYHEFAHQILYIMTGKNRAPTWLSEGIAVFTASVRIEHGRVLFKGTAYNDGMTLPKLLSLTSHGAWSNAVEQGKKNGTGSPYPVAGSVVTFCMKVNDGRYRDDFMDYLRDSYRGKARNPVWSYLGISKMEFAREYQAWGKKSKP